MTLLIPGKRERVASPLTERERGTLEESADAAENGPGAGSILDDPIRGQTRFLKIWWASRKPLDASMTVSHHGRKRLADFMSDRGRELSHAQNLREMGELSLSFH